MKRSTKNLYHDHLSFLPRLEGCCASLGLWEDCVFIDFLRDDESVCIFPFRQQSTLAFLHAKLASCLPGDHCEARDRVKVILAALETCHIVEDIVSCCMFLLSVCGVFEFKIRRFSIARLCFCLSSLLTSSCFKSSNLIKKS